jgi:hypothetical protein
MMGFLLKAAQVDMDSKLLLSSLRWCCSCDHLRILTAMPVTVIVSIPIRAISLRIHRALIG